MSAAPPRVLETAERAVRLTLGGAELETAERAVRLALRGAEPVTAMAAFVAEAFGPAGPGARWPDEP